MRNAAVHIAETQTNVQIRIGRMFGDGTGLIHTHADQKFIIEYTEGGSRSFVAGVNLKMDEGSEIIFPSTVYIYGDGVQLRDATEVRALDLNGRLTGVSSMIVARGKTLFLDLNFHTAQLQAYNGGDDIVHATINDNGVFSMGVLDVKSASILRTGPDALLKGSVGELDLRFEAVLSAETIELSASNLNVEKGARVTTSVLDRAYDTLDYATGQGQDGTHFSGGGHASRGGFDYNSGGTAVEAEGGAYYGDAFEPVLRGARGGAGSGCTAGGAGAGVIKVTVANELFLDGKIEANGGDVTGNCGGGSGGSVLITTRELDGHGEFEVMGGTGAFGGSGGRIAISVDSEHTFDGTFVTYGGAGSADTYLASGGPGSAYVEDLRYNQPYNVLQIDNNNMHWDQYYTLTGATQFAFSELHLYNGASLQMLDDGTPRNMSIKSMIGDRTGRLHAWENQVVELERAETSSTTMKSPINLFIDDGAQIYLATTTYIVGEGEVAFHFNGEIIGVNRLRVMPRRQVTIGQLATTTRYDENQNIVEGTPGEFEFTEFELGSECQIEFPQEMGAKFTISEFVSDVFRVSCFYCTPVAS